MGGLINLSQEHRHGKTGALNHPSHKFAPHLIGGRFVDVVAITFKARLNITVEDRWPLPSLQASPIFVESQMKPWVMSNEYSFAMYPRRGRSKDVCFSCIFSKTGASSTIRLTFWRSWKGSGPKHRESLEQKSGVRCGGDRPWTVSSFFGTAFGLMV